MDGTSTSKQQQQHEHHAPLKVASDHTIAMEAAGRPMTLERNDTLCIDKVGFFGGGATHVLGEACAEETDPRVDVLASSSRQASTGCAYAHTRKQGIESYSQLLPPVSACLPGTQLGSMRRTEDMHVFSANYDIYALPKRHMPKHGMPPKVAQQGITDLRQLDANPR